MSANESVIKYAKGFKKEDWVQMKPKAANPQGQGDRYEKCAIIATGGIEVLLYVIENISIASSSLNINTLTKYFEFFMKILGYGPLEKFKRLRAKNAGQYTYMVVTWTNTQGVQEQVDTVSGFQNAVKDFVKLYIHNYRSKRRSNQVPQAGGMQKAYEGFGINASGSNGRINAFPDNVGRIKTRSNRG